MYSEKNIPCTFLLLSFIYFGLVPRQPAYLDYQSYCLIIYKSAQTINYRLWFASFSTMWEVFSQSIQYLLHHNIQLSIIFRIKHNADCFIINLNGILSYKNIESLCCTCETNIVNQLYYNKNNKNKNNKFNALYKSHGLFDPKFFICNEGITASFTAWL